MRAPSPLLLFACLLLTACASQTAAPPPAAPTAAMAVPPTAAAASALAAAAPPAPPAADLDPQGGTAIGSTFEAFLSPSQEPGEEKDTPAQIPAAFRSTAPSLLRSERQSRGNGVVRFSKDLSRAYVDLAVLGVKPEDVVLFHIHCGKPDSLGPIIVDFGLLGGLPEQFAGGKFSAEISNDLIERTTASGDGMMGAFTMGCPIPPSLSLMGDVAPGKVKTVAGMESIARIGELYFNLHTRGQVYYGDIRGQLYQVSTP
jgi:hypothetical protein